MAFFCLVYYGGGLINYCTFILIDLLKRDRLCHVQFSLPVWSYVHIRSQVKMCFLSFNFGSIKV